MQALEAERQRKAKLEEARKQEKKSMHDEMAAAREAVAVAARWRWRRGRWRWGWGWRWRAVREAPTVEAAMGAGKR